MKTLMQFKFPLVIALAAGAASAVFRTYLPIAVAVSAGGVIFLYERIGRPKKSYLPPGFTHWHKKR